MNHLSTNDAIPSLPPASSNSKEAEARRSTAMTEQTDYSFFLSFQRSNSVRSSITIDNALKSFNIKEDLDESEHPNSVTSHSSLHHHLSGMLGLKNPLTHDQEDDHSEFVSHSCDTSDWEEDSTSITSRNMSETEDWFVALETEQKPQKMNKNDMLGLTLKMKHLAAMESPTQYHYNKTENTYKESFRSMATLASGDCDDNSIDAQAEEEQESVVGQFNKAQAEEEQESIVN
jgi:hypothetical protein